MIYFDGHAQRISKGAGANRHDHEFLDIHVVVGMLATIENVHHGHRQTLGVETA